MYERKEKQFKFRVYDKRTEEYLYFNLIDLLLWQDRYKEQLMELVEDDIFEPELIDT